MTQQQEIREGHPYFMYDAITGQPGAIQAMLREHIGDVEEVASVIAGKRRLHIVGIGTSWHAALIAHHWFRQLAYGSLDVHVWHSFEFCGYPPPLNPDDAVIIISHRGTKTYSFLALEMAKAKGAYTVAISSTDPGPRLQIADAAIHTVAPERSAAFTISYTTALTVLARLATAVGAAIGNNDDLPSLRVDLESVPAKIEQVLSQTDAIQQAVEKFQGQGRFICASWGPNTANSYEVALKMKETSAVDSEGLQIEQLLHGPFCSVDDSCLVTLVAPPGPGYERALNVARASNEVGAPVWALVQQEDTQLSELAAETFTLPMVSEFWSPLVYVVPLQLFTYYLALARNTHPDLFQQDNPKQAAARRHYDL